MGHFLRLLISMPWCLRQQTKMIDTVHCDCAMIAANEDAIAFYQIPIAQTPDQLMIERCSCVF